MDIGMKPKTIAVGAFKQTCLAEMERVRTTGRALLVTKRGTPLVMVVPIGGDLAPAPRLGYMAGTGRILGDIVGPAVDADEWEVLRS
jgi:hypothetical protein